MALVKYNNNSISSVTSAASFPSGDGVLIKTLTASGSSTLSFVHGTSDVVLNNTYPIYFFKFINIHPSGNNRFQVNFSADTGSNYNVSKTTTVWIAANNEAASDSTLTKQNSDDLSASTSFQDLMAYGNQDSDDDHSLNGTLHLFNPSSTTFVKHFFAHTNIMQDNTHSQFARVAGYCNTTSAINAVQFSVNSGNIDSGQILLFGLN